MWANILSIIGVWSLFGLSILGLTADTAPRSGDIFSLYRLNPLEVYKNYRVNYFGCFVVVLFFNLLCPLISISYWFYKLCTVGRK